MQLPPYISNQRKLPQRIFCLTWLSCAAVCRLPFFLWFFCKHCLCCLLIRFSILYADFFFEIICHKWGMYALFIHRRSNYKISFLVNIIYFLVIIARTSCPMRAQNTRALSRLQVVCVWLCVFVCVSVCVSLNMEWFMCCTLQVLVFRIVLVISLHWFLLFESVSVIFGSCFVLSITNVVLLFTQDAIEFVLQNFGEMNKLWVCNSELANFL